MSVEAMRKVQDLKKKLKESESNNDKLSKEMSKVEKDAKFAKEALKFVDSFKKGQQSSGTKRKQTRKSSSNTGTQKQKKRKKHF